MCRRLYVAQQRAFLPLGHRALQPKVRNGVMEWCSAKPTKGVVLAMPDKEQAHRPIAHRSTHKLFPPTTGAASARAQLLGAAGPGPAGAGGTGPPSRRRHWGGGGGWG